MGLVKTTRPRSVPVGRGSDTPKVRRRLAAAVSSASAARRAACASSSRRSETILSSKRRSARRAALRATSARATETMYSAAAVPISTLSKTTRGSPARTTSPTFFETSAILPDTLDPTIATRSGSAAISAGTTSEGVSSITWAVAKVSPRSESASGLSSIRSSLVRRSPASSPCSSPTSPDPQPVTTAKASTRKCRPAVLHVLYRRIILRLPSHS